MQIKKNSDNSADGEAKNKGISEPEMENNTIIHI
jgi:hypothetical protein